MAIRANRLGQETSPYLLQHAHNPVDWFPWGPDALSRARSEDRPILLSIGYAACHWCHVMERESFEDAATARLMNEHFVCIKVDREERPDLDDIYMAATVAMTGHGGWPMTVFLTPEQKPFFAGTYFPPQDAHGRPGFKTLLSRIAEVWTEDRAGIERQAGQLTQQVTAQLGHTCPQAVSDETLSLAARQLRAQYDPRWGGFGGAPKFPPCGALHLLLRHHVRTGDARSVEMVRGTLDAMHDGGIFDHVGGGFARYSTDERWHVPHFEKMLYDNGQLARVYVEAFQATGEERYALVARRTLDYLLREMQSESGAFYSATDADSEGVEGKFFVFTPAEIVATVGAQDAPAVCAFFDVREEGNWEGHNVLWTPRPASEVAETLGMSEEALRARVERALPLLYEARARRVPPLLDDKVLVSWNALAIGALAIAAQVLNEPRYLASAERAASDLWQRLRDADGRLLRTARGEGPAHLTAYLEDYAYLGDALIDLYEAGAPFVWLQRSLELSGFILMHFGSDRGAFHHTADDHESLLTRSLDGQDGAMPSANAVCARMLLRLSSHLGEPELEVKARAALEAFGELVERAPRAYATTLAALDMLGGPAVEIALVGPPGEVRNQLERAVAACPLPRRVLAHGAGDGSEPHPMLRGKTPPAGQPAVYLCRNFACEEPLTDPALVREALRTSV